MLEELRIDNLGVIASAQISPAKGLTVITGETGAGKTMVLTGLSWLLGAKADAGQVRIGADAAVVEGRWQLTEHPGLTERVLDAGGLLDDDGSVVALRTVAAGGRSRAHLGGRAVPAALLAEVASDLVTVHGQSDQLRLRSAVKQREALDAFAGTAHLATLSQYQAAWAARARCQAQIDDLTTRADERAREASLLRAGLTEIERINPLPGEDDELAALAARLGNLEQLRLAAGTAYEGLAGDDHSHTTNAVGQLDAARRALEAAVDDDAELADLAARLKDANLVVAEVAGDLARYLDSLVADPNALEFAHARLSELTSLNRTFGGSVEAVLQWASDAGLRLLDLDDDGERVAELETQLSALDVELDQLAGALSMIRRSAAGALAEAITAELHGLAMTGAHLVIEVEALDELGPAGADQVEFLLVPHPGAPARPLSKGASGGELSRLMLAVEVSLAAGHQTAGRLAGGPSATADGLSLEQALPTFVFDEVDAGIGGRAATEVGRRLGQLATNAQVIVVTHLAQVAAFADTHLVVVKSASDNGVVTGVVEVTGDDRVIELARMLSGSDDSSTARQHAAELIDAANTKVAGSVG